MGHEGRGREVAMEGGASDAQTSLVVHGVVRMTGALKTVLRLNFVVELNSLCLLYNSEIYFL